MLKNEAIIALRCDDLVEAFSCHDMNFGWAREGVVDEEIRPNGVLGGDQDLTPSVRIALDALRWFLLGIRRGGRGSSHVEWKLKGARADLSEACLEEVTCGPGELQVKLDTLEKRALGRPWDSAESATSSLLRGGLQAEQVTRF